MHIPSYEETCRPWSDSCFQLNHDHHLQHPSTQSHHLRRTSDTESRPDARLAHSPRLLPLDRIVPPVLLYWPASTACVKILDPIPRHSHSARPAAVRLFHPDTTLDPDPDPTFPLRSTSVGLRLSCFPVIWLPEPACGLHPYLPQRVSHPPYDVPIESQ